MFLVYCPTCDRYTRTADIGQRVRYAARLDTETGNFRALNRQHILDEILSSPERIWCAECRGNEGSVVEVAVCPCEGTTPATEGQYWWEVRHATARCTLCDKTVQGSTVIEWGA